MIRSSYSLREPLLIVRLSILWPGLPTSTKRPAKDKTYQDHTFRIPLEIDDDDLVLVLLKLEHLSWLCMLALAWWSLVDCSPMLLWERLSFRLIFTSPWSPYEWQASSIWSLRDVHLELALCLDQPCIFSSDLHKGDVLKINKMTPTISFFKTCLQWAQPSHDHSLDLLYHLGHLDFHPILLLFAFQPTYGLQALPMDKSYKYNSKQTLVHRDCH